MVFLLKTPLIFYIIYLYDCVCTLHFADSRYTKYNIMTDLLCAQITYSMEINVILIIIENQQPRV